jgi:iron(III) transport system substrate-binding protein
MHQSRHRFIEAGFVSILTAAGAPAVAAPAWQAQWADLVSAAKKEGKLSMLSLVGAGFRRWTQAAEAAFPGISIDHQQEPNGDLMANKVLAERDAGIHTFDLFVMSPVTTLPRLKPVGAVDKLRPLLFRPDVLNDKAWIGGFDKWGDAEKSYGFPLTESVYRLAINTAMVDARELKNASSLLDPKWKAKIIMTELKAPATRALITSIRLRYGDDAVKRLIIDQAPTYVQDPRQIAEALVRGTMPIGHGITLANLVDFRDAGLAGNVKFIDVPDVSYITSAFSLWAANRAPHPNAAKLIANWFLTRDGQQAFATNVGLNARRTDVPPIDPTSLARPGQRYFYSSVEASFPDMEKTRALITRLTGSPA